MGSLQTSNELSRHNNTNLAVTPLSVLVLLTQIALNADDPSFTELTKLVNLDTREKIRELMPYLQVFIENQTALTFYTAQKVYANDQYQLKYAFIKHSTELFRADAENIDFTNSVRAAANINRWVTVRTNNTITSFASPDLFDAMTNIYLVDAVYFKGFWETKFDTTKTVLRDFYALSSSGPIQVETMNIKTQLLYADNKALDAKLVEIPYVGDFAFVIVLPNSIDGLNGLLSKLYDYRVLNDLIDTSINRTFDFYVPKFSIDSTVSLSTILEDLNLTTIFNQTASGLSGLLTKPQNVYVSDGMLRTYFEVDENGGDLASVDGSQCGDTNSVVFEANHPFVFFVKLRAGPKCPLFTGIYTGYQ